MLSLVSKLRDRWLPIASQMLLCYKHVDYFILLRISMLFDHMIRQSSREHAGYGLFPAASGCLCVTDPYFFIIIVTLSS